MKPLVSVVLPTYNRADLMAEAITSVLSQTHSRLELIIADDGSTDNTEEVARSFSDKRIVYLKLPHAGLPAPPRNRGIEASKGEFIAFLDSDDLWLESKIEKSLNGFVKAPDAGIICSNEYILLEHAGKTTETYAPKKGNEQVISFERLFMGNIISSSTAVVRRCCFDKVGLFNESIGLRATEDYHMWLRIAAKFKVLYLDQPLGYYRIHEGSIRLDQERSLVNLYNCLTDIWRLHPPLVSSFKVNARSRLREVARSLIALYINKKNLKLASKWMFYMLFPSPITRAIRLP